MITGGVLLTVGPIAGVGTVEVKVTAGEVSVYLKDALGGTSWIGTGADVTGEQGFFGEYEAAVCLQALSISQNFYIDVDDPDPARLGFTARVVTCTGGDIVCRNVLGTTGFELDLGVLANSCIWLDGRQQNPLATCPVVNNGSGLPL